MSYSNIPAGKDAPNDIYVIIEIPANAAPIKYEIDKDSDALFVDRFMGTAMFYPANYGYVPNTLSEDGDPLDALVLVTNPTYPGILIEARPIGLLQMKDAGDLDDKIICVSTNDPRYLHTTDISDIEDHYRSEIAHFFQVYKDLEGKKVEILGWQSAKEAKSIIVESIKRYKNTLKKF